MTGQLCTGWIEIIQAYEQMIGHRVTSFLSDTDKDYCPNTENIFKCFTYFDVQDTKIVILGQDPYHTPGQATGLAFQCATDKVQPSLKNIEKAAGHKVDFDKWAEMGILLLNTALLSKLANQNPI